MIKGDLKIGDIIVFVDLSLEKTKFHYGEITRTYKTINQVLVRTPFIRNDLLKIPYYQIEEVLSFKKGKIYKLKQYYE